MWYFCYSLLQTMATRLSTYLQHLYLHTHCSTCLYLLADMAWPARTIAQALASLLPVYTYMLVFTSNATDDLRRLRLVPYDIPFPAV